MNADEIIEAIGGMSRFQIVLIFVLIGPRILMSWGMLMMSFAGVPPEEWWCVDDVAIGVNGRYMSDNGSSNLKICPSDNATCTYVYSQEKDTVINEWDLLCENRDVKPFIIAVQMGGVLVGCIVSGQSSDVIGRKKTYMICLLLHAGFNLVAAFSTSWHMFTVLRFFIGSMVGALLTVCIPYYMEFVGRKYRTLTTTISFWSIGSALLAMASWLRPNWSHLHIILAAMHVPFFVALFFAPESLRWLAIRGRLEEAEAVVDRIALCNRREKPVNTPSILRKLAEEEQQENKESARKYTYIDIYRSWSLCWKSIVIQFVWMAMSFVYYGISFGVGRLHGNLYLNMFLMVTVPIPGAIAMHFLSNKIGRRWTTFLFFAIATCGAFGVVIASRLVDFSNGRGPVTTAFALLCRFGVASAWSGYMIIASETYPTPIRNLGYGAANAFARVGAIISPYSFAVGGEDLMPPFVIVGSVMAVCAVLCLVLRETKDSPLEDTTNKSQRQSSKSKEANVSWQAASNDIAIVPVSYTSTESSSFH